MRYLTPEEARDLGVLLEVNRRLLHPRGLALEATVEAEGKPVHGLLLYPNGLEALRELSRVARENGLMVAEHLDDLDAKIDEAAASPTLSVFKIQDHRDDPEGVYFGDTDDDRLEKVLAFDGLLRPEREERLGYVVQPLEEAG